MPERAERVRRPRSTLEHGLSRLGCHLQVDVPRPDSRGIHAVQTPSLPARGAPGRLQGNPNCPIERGASISGVPLRSSVFCGLLISGWGWKRVEDSWGLVPETWVLFWTGSESRSSNQSWSYNSRELYLFRIEFLKIRSTSYYSFERFIWEREGKNRYREN